MEKLISFLLTQYIIIKTRKNCTYKVRLEDLKFILDSLLATHRKTYSKITWCKFKLVSNRINYLNQASLEGYYNLISTSCYVEIHWHGKRFVYYWNRLGNRGTYSTDILNALEWFNEVSRINIQEISLGWRVLS